MFGVMTMIISQIFSKFTDYKTPRNNLYNTKLKEPMNSFTRRCICCYPKQGFKLLRYEDRFGENIKKKRAVVVRFNNVKFNGGGGGGGGNDDSGTARGLRNFGLGVGLIFLSLTGQLGWIVDAIVSFWLLVMLVLVVGFGALTWWAIRDMVEIKCRNCGNEIEVFESMLKYEPQLCPCCSQPFSVVGDEFARDRMKSSKESTFDEAIFNDFFSRSMKGKASSRTIIDVEAIVKDAE